MCRVARVGRCAAVVVVLAAGGSAAAADAIYLVREPGLLFPNGPTPPAIAPPPAW